MFKLLESIIWYLAKASNYRYLCHIRDVGQMCEPLQMHPEEWEAGRQQPSQTPVHPLRLWQTGCRSSSAVVASSLAQWDPLHNSISPHYAEHQLQHHCTLSSPASKPSSLSFFFCIFPHFFCCPVHLIQNTPERTLPITFTSVFCSSFSRMDGSTWRPSPGLAVLWLL